MERLNWRNFWKYVEIGEGKKSKKERGKSEEGNAESEWHIDR